MLADPKKTLIGKIAQNMIVSDLKKIKDGSDISLSGIRADVKKIITEWESSVTDIEDNIQK